MVNLIQIAIVLFALGVACYVGAWVIILDRLSRFAKRENTKLNSLPNGQKIPKSLNPAQIQSVGSVGTSRIAEYEPVERLCRGCGRPAYLHDDEADFNYCNRKANRL